MKTFTTYAEKKAKQFLNLLQGYTKGIRMTAILILLLMGVGNMSAATITSDGTARLYFNMKAVSWWIVSSNDGANYAYFFNSSTNAWSTKATQYSGDTYYVTIPKGSWTTVILTRNSKSGPGWNDKLYNQTDNITLSSTSNYISKFSEGSTSATWGTAVKPASTGSLSASSTSVNIGANVTLTPSLTSNQTINDIKSTTYSISPNSGASTSNNTFTATKSGTYTVTATITYNPDGYTSITSTATATATITVNPWTITWNPNGGSVTPTSSTYDGATAVSLPTPTRTGYNFDGWYTAASGGTKITEVGTTNKPTGNVTYYAHWTPKTYTITLNANGGARDGSATATYNSSTITNLTHPTRTDFRCNGYYTATSGGTLVLNIDGTLAKNVSGYTDANGNWTKDGDATLYAQWTYDVTEYTVTFGVGTGSTSYGSLTAYNNNTSASITSPAQVRSGQRITFTATPKTGYVVEGWYTTAACTADKHNAGNTTYTTTITAATNVYVKFVEKTWSVTVAAGTGGSVFPSGAQTVEQVTGISINANPDNGYTFNKWTIKSGNGTLIDANSASTTFKPTADATVEASFNETLSTLTTSNNYTEGNPGYDAPEASVSKIGIVTTATITATTPSGAYAFTGWTLTNCERTDTGDATALSITVRSMGDGAVATVIANYEKIPSKTVYFKPKTDWKNNNPIIICDEASTAVTPYDCDGEYYTAEVPGGTTDLKFGGNNEKTLSLTVPTDNKVLYDMTSQTITALYLKPNSNWTQASAWFAAYFFKKGDDNFGNEWAKMTDNDGDGTYECSIPTTKSYPNVIFVRMNKDKQSLNWDAKWNQTGDLTIPNDGTNAFTVPSGAWDNSDDNGNWHKVWDNSCWKEFTTPTYQITLKQITGGTISVSKDSGISLNEQVTVTMTASTGYTFKSGTITIGTQSAKTITNPTSTHTICGNATITAEWKPDTHTVTFDANGHGIAPDAQSVDYNEKVTKPDDLTATGYTFGGWYKEENCTNVWDFNNDVVTADITLYAKWTAIKYKIEYTELYDVTHNNPTTYTIESETITFTNPTSERTGYTFKGWNPTEITKGSTGNKTVTAQWTTIDYTITYNTNGGTNPNDAPTSYNVTTATFNLPTPSKTGYTFSGWYDNGGCTGEPITTIPQGTTGDKTFYAKWTANTYTVVFDANGGEGDMEDQEFTYDMGKALTANTFTRTGYDFAGWATSQDGAVAYENQQSVSNLTSTNNGTVTLYAQWSEITYNVKISAGENGTVSPSGDLEIGIVGVQVTAAPKDPSRFRFTKWEVSGGAIVADNYGATTTVTATADGSVIAHFEELQPKTIYLKTVEGTTDGVKWYVKYNDTEYLMDELGCTNEYYKGVVPEGTSFQFVSRDASNNIVETKGTNLQHVEGKTLYNLVSATASGNKIFFNPNTNWLSTNWNDDQSYEGKTPRFAALFDENTWLDMTDNNDDKIFECVKPSGATKVYFCRMKPNTTANSWNEKWQQTDEQTIPNGKNLFTLPANVSLSDWARGGTWSEFADTPVNGDGEWEEFTGVTYRITFDQKEATTAGTTHVDVAYRSSMPEIEKLPAKNEKKFGGYYTAVNGQGVMLLNAFGEWQDAMGYIASGTWESEACLTLYAHWTYLTPEITDVTLNAEIFEPVDENKEGIVTADPTIDEHNNTTLYKVCWKLLYSNGREVEGTQEDPDKYKATSIEGEGRKVQFSIAGLPTGTYIIRASLRTGGDCNSGEEISRYDKKFAIVANRVITVHYTCDGKEIKASTKQNAHVINATSITAPDIVGYTFKEWVAGDGVIISTANKASKTIEFTAYYDGSLTATYTKKKMVYFYNTMGWEDVYVYFYSSDKYWDVNMGSGSDQNKEIAGTKAHWFKYRGKMTQIQGTNIWYFDYLSLGGEIEGYTNVVFNKYQQDDYEWFHNTEVVRRADFNAEKLPMYVPIKAAEENKNGTKYYNKGYWMNYPENTGYKLQIYDGTGDGAKEVASIRFPYSSNTIMPLTVSVDLEAGKTYGFKILREDNTYFSNEGTMTANSNGWSFTYGIDQNCGLKTTLAGDYTFTLKYAAPNPSDHNNYQYCVDVVYPVSVGDYRVVYQDSAEWSLGKAHDANWYHPSYAIKKNNSTTEEKIDIVSFFIAKNHYPSMKFQKCTAISGQTVTWADVANGIISTPKDKTEASVYNFIIKQPAGGESISVESVEPYTGNYYIRVDAMDGKWGNYKTDPDNRMTYSAFSENPNKNKFGELFSHYATKWCEEGTNVKFTIANDYSPCISDTLIQDNGNPFGNINEHGNLNSNEGKYAANIRFMWDRRTNKISRAYVAGSTFTDRQFLILKADKEIKNSAGGNLTNEGDNHNARQAIFEDTQNWIYERTLQVKPTTRVKLYACYPTVDVANAQYFCGTYDNNNTTWDNNNSIQILGGQGESWNTIRVIYDFKTNRLMAAWIPTGEINEEKSLEADMMILRDHQEDAACITFANSAKDKLINVQTVYGVLRFNKYILNNRKTTGGHEILDPKDQKTIYERALYFISFPFDVHLSDVFGFGTYGTHWVISEYNGLRRAKYGFFENNCFSEDCTNWDYIWDPSNVTLQANQGYLLSLDLDLMKHDNESFWAHGINTVELYFPSLAEVNTIQQTDYTMPALGEDYICKIRGQEQVDSYWRCIGVPSFADYNSTLSDGENQIKWQPKGTDFPFLYEWNVSDNSLIVQSTTTYRFRPTYAYLVQNGRAIHWTAVNSKPSTSIIARQRTEAERNYEWKIALMRNSDQEDQTFLRISDNEDVTTEFDFNQDLAKELNYGRSDIYTLINSVRVAANSMPCSDKTTIIPLGLNIEQAGDYTIAMPEGVENIGITLVDNETGIHTNLSAGQEYTITLNKGICENRLFIEVSPIQQSTTDLEYTTEDTREQTTRKMLIDGILYLIRDGVIYDAQGHRL